MDENQELPWYRQFWPWFIMTPPAVSVVAGLVTFYLAGAEPSMVVDDYGQIALATEQRVERERRAVELGLSARIEFRAGASGAEQSVAVTLVQADTERSWPERLHLDLVHPTLAERDRDIVLEGGDGRYAGRGERPSGRIYISLTDGAGSWRMTGEMPGSAVHYELGGER